jgi:GWxTD domain-containing protein
MTSLPSASLRRPWVLGLCLAVVACGGASAGSSPSVQRDQRTISFDPTPIYRQMGLIARGVPFPVVGRVAFVPAASPETTHVALVVGFAPNALRFNRETDNRFRANYSIGITVERDGEVAFTTETTETVVVGSFRETERGDESLVFQEIFDLRPGSYRLTLTLRDVSSQRGVTEQAEMQVPDFSRRALSTPVPVNKVVARDTRDSLPFILLRPRAMASLGQDSVIPIYLESLAPQDTLLELVARGETGRVLWSEFAGLRAHDGIASGVIQVPVTRLGIGVSQLSFVNTRSDTASTYVYVGFGDDLPIARFEDMLQFLRYFARPQRLQALREASEEQRPAAWVTFMRETDSIPSTPVHEDLRAYFGRVVRANNRFREDGVAGWMSDRGRVFIVLGEPDQIIEPTTTDFGRPRQQLWEYRDRALQLQFFDQTGAGRWRLTQASDARFEVELRRQLR